MLRIGIALPVVALGLTLAACSDPPAKGEVISTKYDRAHYDEYLYCGAYTTTTVNGVSSTTCTVWLPGHHWVPDEWSLKLKNDKHTGWRAVPQQVYNGPCGQLGAYFPDCEGNHGVR